MTKKMCLLCYFAIVSEFWSVKLTSMYENSEWKVFKNIKISEEVCNNWQNNLLAINVFKTLESCSNSCWHS